MGYSAIRWFNREGFSLSFLIVGVDHVLLNYGENASRKPIGESQQRLLHKLMVNFVNKLNTTINQIKLNLDNKFSDKV